MKLVLVLVIVVGARMILPQILGEPIYQLLEWFASISSESVELIAKTSILMFE